MGESAREISPTAVRARIPEIEYSQALRSLLAGFFFVCRAFRETKLEQLNHKSRRWSSCAEMRCFFFLNFNDAAFGVFPTFFFILSTLKIADGTASSKLVKFESHSRDNNFEYPRDMQHEYALILNHSKNEPTSRYYTISNSRLSSNKIHS